MKLLDNIRSYLKDINKLCDPLVIYIIMGIFKFYILLMIYKDFVKEGFSPINQNYKLNSDIEPSKCSECNDEKPCPHKMEINRLHLIMVINIMFYMYIVFGIFLYLLCKNNMKKSVWFIILYPFLSKLVWMLII